MRIKFAQRSNGRSCLDLNSHLTSNLRITSQARYPPPSTDDNDDEARFYIIFNTAVLPVKGSNKCKTVKYSFGVVSFRYTLSFWPLLDRWFLMMMFSLFPVFSVECLSTGHKLTLVKLLRILFLISVRRAEEKQKLSFQKWFTWVVYKTVSIEEINY